VTVLAAKAFFVVSVRLRRHRILVVEPIGYVQKVVQHQHQYMLATIPCQRTALRINVTMKFDVNLVFGVSMGRGGSAILVCMEMNTEIPTENALQNVQKDIIAHLELFFPLNVERSTCTALQEVLHLHVSLTATIHTVSTMAFQNLLQYVEAIPTMMLPEQKTKGKSCWIKKYVATYQVTL